MNRFTRNIPNILTIIRIVLTPFIVFFTIKDKIIISTILIAIAAFTDFLDGKIARTFSLTSKIGSLLDTIADKLFGGTIIISLIIINKLFILCLVLELIISIINTVAYFKKINTKSSYIGKVKTTVLFITLILGFISKLNNNLVFYTNIFIILTTILQLISAITYIINYYSLSKKQAKKN